MFPEVMSPTGFMRRRLLFKEKYHLWDCQAELWQHINEHQLRSMWRDGVKSSPERILQMALYGALQSKRRKETGCVQE